MRPATAHFDFQLTDAASNKGFIKYNSTYTMDPNPNNPDVLDVPVPAAEQRVPFKFRRAASTFPDGFAVKNDQWINYADSGQFGWKSGTSPNSGQGMHDLGQMLSQSKAFSRCLVKRVFSTVCKRDLTSANTPLIDKLATDFENNNYSLKDLFATIAVRPECMGVESL